MLVTDPAVAVKVAAVEPEATVTDVGTVRAELLSDRATAVPADGAVADKVTVQVLAAPDARVVGLHSSEDRVIGDAAVMLREAVLELPLSAAVTTAV